MSLSTVSATIQDPSGQAFSNGTWQLVFKPAPNTPGLFTDGGVSFTTIFRGSLDGAGSFSQAVARNDTIAPAGSRWTLTVAPNANGQAFSVDLNVNSGAFNASAAINAVVTNIVVQALPITHAYKDSEVIPIPGSGGLYYDVTLKVLKVWDTATSAWVIATVTIPTGTGFIHITGGVQDAAAKLVTPSDATGSTSGSGNFALTTSPIFITPTLGNASATSISAAGILSSTGTSGLPAATGTSLFLAGNFGSPHLGKLYIGDGTGWQFDFSKRIASVDTDLISIKDNASIVINTTSGTLPATIANDTAGGFLFTSNAGKSIQFNNSNGHLFLNGAGAVLGLAGVTSGNTFLQGPAIGAGNTLALPNANDTLVAQALAQTLTSKRVTPRLITTTSAANAPVTLTADSDNDDVNAWVLTGTGGVLTIAAPTGTPTDGQKLVLRIKTTNAWTYSFNATFAFSTSVTAPTTTGAGKTDYIGLMWNATNTKWDVVAVDQGH